MEMPLIALRRIGVYVVVVELCVVTVIVIVLVIVDKVGKVVLIVIAIAERQVDECASRGFH